MRGRSFALRKKYLTFSPVEGVSCPQKEGKKMLLLTIDTLPGRSFEALGADAVIGVRYASDRKSVV